MASVVQNVVVPYTFIGTQKNDIVDYQVPDSPAGPPSPLLVAWHGWGNSQAICYSGSLGNPALLTECNSRGWYLLCPLCISNNNHGHPEALLHADKIIEWVMDSSGLGWNINTDKIYHIGHSMGGGSVATYASTRYKGSGYDYPPAAVITIAGVMDQRQGLEYSTSEVAKTYAYTYFKADILTNPDVFDASSAVVMMENGEADPGKSLAKNLTAPIYICSAVNDTTNGGTMVKQNKALENFLNGLGKTYTTEWVEGSEHSWNIIDLEAALDWVNQFTL